MAPLRWGIAAAGRISNDFSTALSSHSTEQHQIVAVAARSLSSAQDFAQKFNIPKFYDGYEKLAADAEVGMGHLFALQATAGRCRRVDKQQKIHKTQRTAPSAT